MPASSYTSHASAILPPAIRKMTISSTVQDRPVASMPEMAWRYRTDASARRKVRELFPGLAHRCSVESVAVTDAELGAFVHRLRDGRSAQLRIHYPRA